MKKRFSTFTSLLFILGLLPGLITVVQAQETKVWDKPKDAKKQAADRLDKGKKGFKHMKAHAEQWGHADKYQHQLAIGGKLNSNGWSGCLYYLKRTGDVSNNVWSLSFSEIKHEKQIKQQRPLDAFPDLGETSPYIFGKVNNLYTLQLGYSRQVLLLPGVVENNLSVSFRYGGGFSLALLKPYYMRLIYPAPDRIQEEKYIDSNAEMYLDKNRIMGGSKWKKGLDELKPVPGAFAELAIVIEPAKSKYLVQMITIGTNFAFYSDKLPIMAKVEAFPWQGSLFVGLSLGKRWE
jgi:hypothetical protein